MKNFYRSVILIIAFTVSFSNVLAQKIDKKTEALTKDINTFMDQWHKDAANADTIFFDKMAPNGIYIGTDKTEIWKRDEFKKWAKPFFLRKSAWNFKATQRNVYFSDDKKYAWFDEQLDTWMGVCQSSGVLKRKGKTWEIEHYQLSVTLPNDVTKDFIKMVKEYEKK